MAELTQILKGAPEEDDERIIGRMTKKMMEAGYTSKEVQQFGETCVWPSTYNGDVWKAEMFESVVAEEWIEGGHVPDDAEVDEKLEHVRQMRDSESFIKDKSVDANGDDDEIWNTAQQSRSTSHRTRYGTPQWSL